MHAFAGIWSLLAVGIFADYITIEGTTVQLSGFFKSWNLKLFGEQILTCVCIISWAVVITPIEVSKMSDLSSIQSGFYLLSYLNMKKT